MPLFSYNIEAGRRIFQNPLSGLTPGSFRGGLTVGRTAFNNPERAASRSIERQLQSLQSTLPSALQKATIHQVRVSQGIQKTLIISQNLLQRLFTVQKRVGNLTYDHFRSVGVHHKKTEGFQKKLIHEVQQLQKTLVNLPRHLARPGSSGIGSGAPGGRPSGLSGLLPSGLTTGIASAVGYVGARTGLTAAGRLIGAPIRAAGAVAQGTGRLLGAAGRGAASTGRVLGRVGGALGKFAPGLGLALGAGGAIRAGKQGDYLKALTEGVSGVASIVPGLGPLVGLGISAIGELIPKAVREKFNTIAAPLIESMSTLISNTYRTALDTIFGKNSGAAGKIAQFFGTGLGNILESTRGIWDDVKTILQSDAAKYAAVVVTGLGGVVAAGTVFLSDTLLGGIKSITGFVKDVVTNRENDYIKSLTTSFETNIVKPIGGFLEKIGHALEQFSTNTLAQWLAEKFRLLGEKINPSEEQTRSKQRLALQQRIMHHERMLQHYQSSPEKYGPHIARTQEILTTSRQEFAQLQSTIPVSVTKNAASAPKPAQVKPLVAPAPAPSPSPPTSSPTSSTVVGTPGASVLATIGNYGKKAASMATAAVQSGIGYVSSGLSTIVNTPSAQASTPPSGSSSTTLQQSSPKGGKYSITHWDALINASAQRNGVDPKLIKAVMLTESYGNPNARGSAGEIGLMQLKPGTAKDMGVTDLTDPAQNIEGGTRYIKWLTGFFKGDVTKAIAAYNRGPGTIQKIGIDAKGQSYLNTVSKHYGQALGNGAVTAGGALLATIPGGAAVGNVVQGAKDLANKAVAALPAAAQQVFDTIKSIPESLQKLTGVNLGELALGGDPKAFAQTVAGDSPYAANIAAELQNIVAGLADEARSQLDVVKRALQETYGESNGEMLAIMKRQEQHQQALVNKDDTPISDLFKVATDPAFEALTKVFDTLGH